MFFSWQTVARFAIGFLLLIAASAGLSAELDSQLGSKLGSERGVELDSDKKNDQLKLVPNKCVALRKGRKCFATIKISWSTRKIGNYCLRRLSDKLEINCWKNSQLGKYKYIFSSSKDEQIELIRKNDQQAIVISKVKVSWVHNSKKRRTRWRVF